MRPLRVTRGLGVVKTTEAGKPVAIGPLPIRRQAVAHPETADAVFRKVLRKPSFTWADHGEALLRRRKPWYYEQAPRPGVSVIGSRLEELAGLWYPAAPCEWWGGCGGCAFEY